ncbi:MAG: hypothetical protein ACXVAU_14435, partial [Mucilaginibacter sp.]
MSFLLHLTARQLFILFFLLFCFSAVPIIGVVFELLFLVLYIGWIYEIGTSMQALLPIKNKPGTTHFKYCCVGLAVVWVGLVISEQYRSPSGPFTNNPIAVFLPCLAGALILNFYLIFSVWMF